MSEFQIGQVVFDETEGSPSKRYSVRVKYETGEEGWVQEHSLSPARHTRPHSIEGIVRRVTPGTAYPCHGSECLEIEGHGGMPSLPLDWMAGAMLPEGARIRITVEVLDPAEGTVPLNWWHQNRQSFTPPNCVCKRHPDQTTIKIEELR